jgi:hypothetical protein
MTRADLANMLEPFRQRLLSEASPPGNEKEVRHIIAELRADA